MTGRCASGPQIFLVDAGAALSMSVIAETEHARSEQLDNPESIYRACTDMKLFHQEVLRVILLDTRYRHISTIEITKGSINESLAHPRDIFRPIIGQSAYVFELPVIRRLVKLISP
jgi:DNA repair protein RadC